MYNLINESAALILMLQTELLRGGRQGARSMVCIFTLVWENVYMLHPTKSLIR